MEPLKRGLSLFNFCYILNILLRAHHGCLNSTYFRNSHRDWNSTFCARVRCLQGLSFIIKIHVKICVELRCGRSEAFRLCWSFWLHSYKKPLLRGASWIDAMKFSKTEIYPELHTICCRFCAAVLSSKHNGFFTVSARYTCINPRVSNLCPQLLQVLKLIETLYTDTVIPVPTRKQW